MLQLQPSRLHFPIVSYCDQINGVSLPQTIYKLDSKTTKTNFSLLQHNFPDSTWLIGLPPFLRIKGVIFASINSSELNSYGTDLVP